MLATKNTHNGNDTRNRKSKRLLSSRIFLRVKLIGVFLEMTLRRHIYNIIIFISFSWKTNIASEGKL